MIIKSHIRGGFRDAAAYLKEQGQNEKTRLVEISDPHAQNLDEAFRAMWAVADGTKVKKALHHVSINPMKDERLIDKQVKRICERLEDQYGYKRGDHQRVIVEHIKDGRQHFHVIWNRVSLATGKPHYPFKHKMQSKIVAREMEIELGLKKPTPSKKTRAIRPTVQSGSRITNFVRPTAHIPQPTTFINASQLRKELGIILKSGISASSQISTYPRPVRPMLPTSTSGMCEAQRIDLAAASEGKITWAQYFQKWGNPHSQGGCSP